MRLGFKCPEKLAPVFNQRKRYKIILGGRGSGKSQTVHTISAMEVAKYKQKFLCLREYMSSIADSSYALLEEVIHEIGIPGYDIKKAYINHILGGQFRFKGLARSIDSIKSYHGFDKFLIEESQFLSSESIKIITPTLRSDDSEIWMLMNPGSSLDPVSIRFLNSYWDQILDKGFYEDDMYLIIRMNYYDNPFFPEVLENERQEDFRILSRSEYDHIWLGEFNDNVENAVIKKEWFDAAVDAHLRLGFEPTGAEVVAHDPSDTGNDDKGLVHRRGVVILDAVTKSDGDVNEGLDWALDFAIDKKTDFFIWDAEGLGVSLARPISKALKDKKIDYIAYKGSSSVERPLDVYDSGVRDKKKTRTNKEAFFNLRCQKIWHLRERFLKTYKAVTRGVYIDPDELISISSSIKQLNLLRAETCRIPRIPNGAGKIQIMPKPQMKAKLGIESPNLFDALTMSETEVSLATKSMEIEFDSLW